MMANYLVTGGGGFIGSHLVHGFVDQGHSVRVVDDFSSGRRENLAEVADKVDILEGDIRDPAVCTKACDGMDVIFHQAAIPSVPISVDHPVPSHESNIDGTFNMLLAAKDRKCRRFIYAASSSAYGESPVTPKHEQLLPTPLSPYAVQKLTGELYLRAFYECYGLESFGIRYFNVFGPRQNPKSQYAAAIPAFVTAILGDEQPIVYGDGEQTRDWTYVENIVHANTLAAEAKVTRGEVANAACGEEVSVNAIIARINELLGKDIKPTYLPPRPGDIKHSLADNSLAKKIIGYEPQVLFEEGLRRAIDYYAGLTVS
jgi:UDP-glucose 4-epimerase